MRIINPLCSMVLPVILLAALAIAGCGDGTAVTTASPDTPATASLAMKSSVARKTVSARGLDRLWEMLRPRTLYAAVSGITDGGGNAIELTDFLLSIRDIKFMREGVDVESEEVEIRGPFVVDLLSPAQPLTQFIADADIPPGIYDGIRFVLHKSPDTPAPLNDWSLYIAGTINPGSTATPFEIFHDSGENLDSFGPNSFVMEPGALKNVLVDIKLLSIFDQIDLTPLDDGTGQIVFPGDSNGIADAIKDAIKEAADFGVDSNDDGNLSESEDVD